MQLKNYAVTILLIIFTKIKLSYTDDFNELLNTYITFLTRRAQAVGHTPGF